MSELEIIVNANNEGKYKTVDVLRQIKNKCKNICFPNKDIFKTSLSELTFDDKRCIKGEAEGITSTWDNNKIAYMERKMTLYFN